SLPYIFDRFYQAENDPANYSEGTGIGLALTKELVELMGGTISVISTPGRGSAFTVQLPIHRHAPLQMDGIADGTAAGLEFDVPAHDPEPIRTDPSPLPDSTESDKYSVLIIEDNVSVAQYLINCLRDKYSVMHAPDGRTGVEMAFASMPDIIICDVMMPEMNGYEVCTVLKSDKRSDHIPIIIL